MTEKSPFGYAGKILRINLSNKKISNEPTKKYAKKWLGGRGINMWTLYNEVKPWTTPYSPSNRLIIGTGPLTGTLAPGSARYNLAS